ncbi:MAG: hypothetical protein ACKO5A_00550 [Actinomycetota bacterium]
MADVVADGLANVVADVVADGVADGVMVIGYSSIAGVLRPARRNLLSDRRSEHRTR